MIDTVDDDGHAPKPPRAVSFVMGSGLDALTGTVFVNRCQSANAHAVSGGVDALLAYDSVHLMRDGTCRVVCSLHEAGQLGPTLREVLKTRTAPVPFPVLPWARSVLSLHRAAAVRGLSLRGIGVDTVYLWGRAPVLLLLGMGRGWLRHQCDRDAKSADASADVLALLGAIARAGSSAFPDAPRLRAALRTARGDIDCLETLLTPK